MLEEGRAPVDPDEARVDVIAVSELEGLPEADRLRADDAAPPLGLQGLPHPAANHHVETSEVHDREVHPVVYVSEDVDLRRQHPQRQSRAVPQPQSRTTARSEQLEEHPREVHTHMLLTSKLSLAPLLRGLVEVLVLLDDIGGRPIGPQLALLDPQCAVARVLDRAHRVGDEEDGAGVLADRPDPALRTVTELLVADVERLVDDEDL